MNDRPCNIKHNNDVFPFNMDASAFAPFSPTVKNGHCETMDKQKRTENPNHKP